MKVRLLKPNDKPLSYFIAKGHTRYISDLAVSDLVEKTQRCDNIATPPERLFWILNKLTEYPKCKACNKTLSSFHWAPYLKPELRSDDKKDLKSGYRPFCGRQCAYTFEGLKLSKARASSLKRFGVENAMQSEVVKDMMKTNNMKRYGLEWPQAWGSSKFQESLMAKHGVLTVRSIPGVSEKIAETKLQQTLEFLPKKIKELEDLLEVKCLTDTTSQVFTRVDELNLEWQHTCGTKWLSNISFRGIARCPKCFAIKSGVEQDLADFVKSLGFETIENDREIIAPKELDIFIPKLNLAIEFDGTYWHSAKFYDAKKSVEKLNICKDKGIKLITVQEAHWLTKQDIVKSRLKSILGINKTIYARTLKVKKLTSFEGTKFFIDNHLQCNARAEQYFGLINANDEILAAMSFAKPRWFKKASWEMIRFASKLEINVVGGGSKLLKAFRNQNSGKIVSYADRCWSEGKIYETLGFTFSHISAPSYWWVSSKLGIYSRYQTQKSKLPKLLGDLNRPFEPGFSEDDNMKAAGFLKVFDRGTSTWILE